MTQIRYILLMGVILIFSEHVHAQQLTGFRMAEGIVRIAEVGELADTVNVWGDINNPGRYLIPRGTRVHELISYARGPSSYRTNETAIDWSKVRVEVNISRYDREGGTEEIRNFQFRYSEPYPEELREYRLQNDEIISLEVKRRAGFTDYLRLVATTVTAVATTILIFQRLD